MKSIALLAAASFVAAKPIEPPYTPPPGSLGNVRVYLYDEPNFKGNEKWVDAALVEFEGKCVEVEAEFASKVSSAKWIYHQWVTAEMCFFENSGCNGTSQCYYTGDAFIPDFGANNTVGSVSINRFE